MKPAAPRNAFWTLIRLNRPSPSWPTTDSASQRTRPPSISTVIPGWPASSEAIRRPLVMTVSWLQPPRALRWRATDRAVVLASMTMLSPSWTRAAPAAPIRCLLVGLEPLADLEGELRPAPVDGDRAAVRPDEAVLRLEDDEVLADRDRRDAELGRQIADPGATVLLDDPGDVLLPLAGEDVARRGAGWERSRLSSGRATARVGDGVSIGCRRTVDATGTQCQEGN